MGSKPLTLASLNLNDDYGVGGEEWLPQARPSSQRSRPTSRSRAGTDVAAATLLLSADEYGSSHVNQGGSKLPPIANSAPSAAFMEGHRPIVTNRLAPSSFMRKGSARTGAKPPTMPRSSTLSGLAIGVSNYGGDDSYRAHPNSNTDSPAQPSGTAPPYDGDTPPETPPLLAPSLSQQFGAPPPLEAVPSLPLMPPGWAAWQAERAGWSQSSVGDLEALDSILDHLVVLDTRMRSALMRGPAISFETVAPDAPHAAPSTNQLDEQDLTFLTSVKPDGPDDDVGGPVGGTTSTYGTYGVAGGPRYPEPVGITTYGEAPARTTSLGPSYQHRVGLHSSGGNTPIPGMSHHGMSHGYGGLDKLTITVATPVMPRLTRLYLGNKVAQLSKAPPAPPATAEYLVRSRPPPFISAPTYDALCNQIQSVQRQYTCGTSGRDTSPGRPNVDNAMQTSNYNQYISGLDGPSLEQVVNTVDLPIVLERARPSFVSMRKSARKKKIRPGRDRASPIRSPQRAPPRAPAHPSGVDGVDGIGNDGQYTDSD